MSFLVSSPDQIFHIRPVDSSKKRSGHAKTRASLHMAISNWVIVGVNYVISYLQHLLWCQKICKLFVMMHSFTWAIWLMWQHADTFVWLRPSFQWMCPDPIFRQGHRVQAKNATLSISRWWTWLPVGISTSGFIHSWLLTAVILHMYLYPSPGTIHCNAWLVHEKWPGFCASVFHHLPGHL